MWVPVQINKGALRISSSMLIARNNIRDVWFLRLSILHYNKFRNITGEHSLLGRSKVEIDLPVMYLILNILYICMQNLTLDLNINWNMQMMYRVVIIADFEV